MSSLYIFATQTGNIPLSELDDNFAEVSQRVNTANYVVAGNQSNITGVGTLTSLSVFGNVTAGNVSVARNISAGNVSTTGILSATGNVTGNYLFGDGGFLSNVTVTSNVAVTQIANGTSVITVNGSGGNATVQIAGTANVAVFQSTGVTVGGQVSVTGNVDAGNLRTTGTVSLAGNVIAAGVVSAGGNVIAAAINLYDGLYAVSASVSGNATIGNVITNGQITAVGNVRGANISTDGTVTAVGNVSGANFNTVGAVSAAGNVSGAYIFGNGSQLTGIVTSSYGNSNVTTLLSNLGSNAVSTTGNVSGGYFFGNGSQLSGLPATYGDSNVTALLSNLGSNAVSTTGNVTGSYIFGNGSQLTGIATSSYGNANVVANLAALSSNPVSTTGNVTAGNLLTTGTLYTTVISAGNTTVGNLLTTGTISALGNATFGNISATGNGTFGNISTAGTFQAASFSATGNVTGSYIFGNGSQLTGIAESSYGNANVAAYLLINTGNISGNVISVSTLNAAVNISGANLRTTGVVSAQGNITVNNGSFFIGNGSQLTGIVAVSSYGDSNVVTLLSGYGSNVISTTGNVTAGNFVGNVVGTGAGTPTITSSGNLDLSVASAVRVIGGGTFRLPNLTTEQIANVTAANGDMVYNSTTSTIQGYEGGGWVRLSAGPLFTAYNSVNQSLTTGTANLVFSTSYDTNSYYSTSTGIFTPLKQGWYQVNAAMLPELTAGTADASIFIGLYKNGVIEAIGAATTVTPTAATISSSTVSKFLYLNGSTDYINCKITSTINSGTWRTFITVANFFQANWVRD